MGDHLVHLCCMLSQNIVQKTFLLLMMHDRINDLLITRSSSTVIIHLSHHGSYQSIRKSFTFKFYPHIRPPTQRSTIQHSSYNTIGIDLELIVNARNRLLSIISFISLPGKLSSISVLLIYHVCTNVLRVSSLHQELEESQL